MSSSNTAVDQLFQGAQSDGILSPESAQVLAVGDLGAQIQAGLGITVDDVQSSEVVLVSILPDDSGSISEAHNEQVVCDGHNLVLDALRASKQADAILAHTRLLNGRVLFPYQPVNKVPKMEQGSNYWAAGGTPLYDQTVLLLGTVLAKAQDFSNSGVVCRTVTLIITDGADLHSKRASASDVAKIVTDMRRAETHIVAAMGIADGQTDFRKVFSAMGIEDKWILTPSNDASSIRQAFQVFSQSAVRASQAAVNFQAASAGGFGAP
jgi:hypothetical protein